MFEINDQTPITGLLLGGGKNNRNEEEGIKKLKREIKNKKYNQKGKINQNAEE